MNMHAASIQMFGSRGSQVNGGAIPVLLEAVHIVYSYLYLTFVLLYIDISFVIY